MFKSPQTPIPLTKLNKSSYAVSEVFVFSSTASPNFRKSFENVEPDAFLHHEITKRTTKLVGFTKFWDFHIAIEPYSRWPKSRKFRYQTESITILQLGKYYSQYWKATHYILARLCLFLFLLNEVLSFFLNGCCINVYQTDWSHVSNSKQYQMHTLIHKTDYIFRTCHWDCECFFGFLWHCACSRHGSITSVSCRMSVRCCRYQTLCM